MGVHTNSDEYPCPISPARLFKAFVLDDHNLYPKILPQLVRSIELIQGHGGVGTGSIKQMNFFEGSPVKSVKNRVDELNEETFTYNYTTIEGGALTDKFESIAYEVKFEATADGGSIIKKTTKYYTKGDMEVSEEKIKAGTEMSRGIYKVVEAYLLQNPDVYA